MFGLVFFPVFLFPVVSRVLLCTLTRNNSSKIGRGWILWSRETPVACFLPWCFDFYGGVRLVKTVVSCCDHHLLSPCHLSPYLLFCTNQVVIVPGYGLAVAGAQYAIADTVKTLTKHGIKVIRVADCSTDWCAWLLGDLVMLCSDYRRH